MTKYDISKCAIDQRISDIIIAGCGSIDLSHEFVVIIHPQDREVLFIINDGNSLAKHYKQIYPHINLVTGQNAEPLILTYDRYIKNRDQRIKALELELKSLKSTIK